MVTTINHVVMLVCVLVLAQLAAEFQQCSDNRGVFSFPPAMLWVGKEEESWESQNVCWDKENFLLCCRDIRLHKGKEKKQTKENRRKCTSVVHRQKPAPAAHKLKPEQKKDKAQPRNWVRSTKTPETGSFTSYRMLQVT